MAPLSDPAADSRQWLRDYFRNRAQLASLHSQFQCDPDCQRPGCKNVDLWVQVSIVDLLGAALHLEEPVSTLYRRHYSLGLFANERTDWIRMVGLKLKKPCPFLANDLCTIYPVRPLACILFPEYIAAEGKFGIYAQNGHFQNFFCFKRPLLLSPERAETMMRLKKMWNREILISSFYLFQHGACHLDLGNLTGELLEAAKGLGEEAAAEKPKSGYSISNLVLERFFLEHLASFPPFAGVEAKIEHLQNPEALEEFLRLLTDDLRRRQLQQQGTEWAQIYRFRRGKLKARWRSLLPPESKYR